LFRAPASDEIVKIILKIWEHFPEHTDAYVAFLENYQRVDDVIILAKRLLMTGYPYDYVQGELWKLLARMCIPSELESTKELAIETIRNSNSGYASRLGAQIFLCRCDALGLGNYQKWLMYEKRALVQALVAPHLNLDTSSGHAVGTSIISRSLVDPHLGLIKPLIASNMQIDVFGKSPTTFPFVAQYAYKAAGLTGHQVSKADAVANLISKRYAVKKWGRWKAFFQGEYQHAYTTLHFADNCYDSYLTLSSWLGHQDSFNEILFICFQKLLVAKSASGVIVLTNPNGKRINYGSLLNNPIFKSAYPNLQDDLSKVHRRRNLLLSSHAYDEKTGDKSKPLKKHEQTKLKKYLDDAYNEIINIAESLGV
jgi:hypothetical protein